MIAIVVKDFYSESNRVGAIARSVIELAKRIKDVIIVTNGKENSLHDFEEVRIYQIKASGVECFKKFRDLIKKLDVKGINFHGSVVGGLLAVKYFKKLNIPIILNLYSHKAKISDFYNLRFKDLFQSFNRIFKHHFFFSLFIPKFLINHYINNKNVKAIIVPSNRLKNLYKGEVYRIPPGVNLKKFKKLNKSKLKKDLGFNKEDKIILYSGLASYLRGIDDLVYAFKNLKKENTKLLLTIYSEKGELISSRAIEDIKNLVKEDLNIKLLTEPVKNIEDYYNIADVVVFPYRFIGDIPECPLTMIEAMACEKPIITYGIGAIPEYVAKGSVVKLKDVNELNNRISSLLSNKNLLIKIGAFARKFVEKEHNWDINSKKMDGILRW